MLTIAFCAIVVEKGGKHPKSDCNQNEHGSGCGYEHGSVRDARPGGDVPGLRRCAHQSEPLPEPPLGRFPRRRALLRQSMYPTLVLSHCTTCSSDSSVCVCVLWSQSNSELDENAVAPTKAFEVFMGKVYSATSNLFFYCLCGCEDSADSLQSPSCET